MHELSIATSLVSLAEDAAADAGEAGPIVAVRVRVGALSGVVVEALEFAWGAASEGTRCEGAGLEVERVPGRVRCPACGSETVLDDPPAFVCGSCGEPTGDVVAGRELDLMSLELEQQDTPTTETPHAAPHP